MRTVGQAQSCGLQKHGQPFNPQCVHAMIEGPQPRERRPSEQIEGATRCHLKRAGYAPISSLDDGEATESVECRFCCKMRSVV